MATFMVSTIANGFIDYIRSHIHNYTSLHGSINYIVALEVNMWCTIALWPWACGMQAEYMSICSIHHLGLVSQ